jgi:predicted Abi (CAAX) family protease
MITTMHIKVAALLASIMLLFGAWQYADSRGYNRARAAYTAAIVAQKAQASALLASETAKVRTAEQALQAITNSQNLKDAENVQNLATLSDRLRRAAGPAGRLRDPHAAGCGVSSAATSSAPATAASDSAADPAQADGLVSEPLSRLLRELTASADQINAAYASCRADAFAVRRAAEP